ncbi:MAG: Cobalamin import ATP-binding protein BtuD [Methanocella sp. PtaU1.Bin125]|nr:MAG: Cobalamin import ATP-binding protein BtuD [Methanocella sp. PtaU1.Bin125]
MGVTARSCDDRPCSISASGLAISFDGSRVLEEVGLCVRRGSIVSLLGPNGCGKTTLLKILGKLLKPDGGAVFINGKNLERTGLAELSRTIGSVAQSHRPSFPFTVRDVVLTGRMPYVSALAVPGRADVEKANETLASLGIAHLADKPYTKTSGGEKQLVMIARALAQEPAVLLLDEPTTYLDLKNQVGVLGIIARLSQENGITVLMTLHDPNQAFIYSDEVILMKKVEPASSGTFDADGGDLCSESVIAAGSPATVLTPENVKKAYGIDVEIIDHGGRKIIVPVA